ncbi:MAG: MMPL family transporter [Zetaproteobacteria bacterium]|nr:MMPL family transporter [Zetaproteobacteria bacterium]
MSSVFQRILAHPKMVLLLLFVLTALAVSQMRHLYIETDLDAMLPKQSDAYINTKVLEERFGSTDMVIIGLMNNSPSGIYNAATLNLVQELTDWLSTEPLFRTLALNDLLSLATIKDIQGSEDGMSVLPFLNDFLDIDANNSEAVTQAIEHLKTRMHDFGIYEDVIASADGHGTLFIVRPQPNARHTYAAIYDLLQTKVTSLEAEHPEVQFFIAGRPVIEGVFGQYMPQEMKRMQPLVMGVLILLLFLSFRTPRGVGLPMLVVLMAEIWTLGTMAALKAPMYTITTMLPILILAIGIADAVHFLSRERLLAHYQAYAHRKERITEVMHELWKPMLLTSVTTGAGFLSMMASELPPIRDFGLFATLGIAYALLITMLLLPSALILLPEKSSHAERKPLFSGYVQWLGNTVLNYPKRITILFALLIMVAFIGVVKLQVNASLVEQFKPGDPLRAADTFLNAHFSGTTTLDIMIDTGRENGLLEPVFLQHLAQLQQQLEQQPMVGDTASIAEFLSTMNQALHNDDPAWRKVPDNSELAAQYLLLYSFSGAPDDFETFITGDYQQAHLRINLKTDATNTVQAIIANIDTALQNYFPAEQGFKVAWAGTGFTVSRLADMIINGQIASLIVSVIAIFLLCWWIFGRVSMAGIAMIPVALAVTVNYGMMGNFGIPLDIATALTGAMAMGIGVDFAIHYLHRYHELKASGKDYPSCVRETNSTVGHAILFNSFVVVGGFLVLLSAALYPQMKLGALIAATMVICYLATCYLFPVLLRLQKH